MISEMMQSNCESGGFLENKIQQYCSGMSLSELEECFCMEKFYIENFWKLIK